MKKILKKISLTITIMFNLCIIFTKSVFADMAIPSNYVDENHFLAYVFLATGFAILVGLIFILKIMDKKKGKNIDNIDDESTINLINNLTSKDGDSKND